MKAAGVSDVSELLGTLRAFAIPMRTRFRGITVREGALIEGPAGWGEFAPFAEYGPRESARWLASALESACVPWPAPGQCLSKADHCTTCWPLRTASLYSPN